MPLSEKPGARARQLANLRPGAGAGDGGLARARSHGAYAAITEAHLHDEELRVYEALAADAPVRADDGGLPREDTLIVRQLAESLVRLQRITTHLVAKGIERDDGSLRPAVELELRVRGHVLDLCRELGMTPKSRAALGVDLVRVANAGDRLQEHLQARYGDDALDGDAAVAEPIDAAALPADAELPDVEGDEHDQAAADDDAIEGDGD